MKQNLVLGTKLVALGQASILKAQNLVKGCAACRNSAARTFESVVRETLGGDGSIEYFLCSPAECPQCGSGLNEATLVSTSERPGFPETAEEEIDVVFVNETTLLEAQSFIARCE